MYFHFFRKPACPSSLPAAGRRRTGHQAGKNEKNRPSFFGSPNVPGYQDKRDKKEEIR